MSSVLGSTRRPPPSLGIAASWKLIALRATPQPPANATRQLVTFPIREARGSAATVATKIPPLTSAIAVPFASSRTSAIAAPEPNTQNPPMHTPSRALAASITREVRRCGGHQVGGQNEAAQAAKQPPPLDSRSRYRKHRRGDRCAYRRHHHHQAGHASRNVQVCADVRQQADWEQLGEDERERAQSDRPDREPAIAYDLRFEAGDLSRQVRGRRKLGTAER